MAEAQEQEQTTGPEGEAQTEQQQAARDAARKGKEQREAKEESGFSLSRLHWYEYIGFLGAFILAGSLFFLPWFATDCASDAAAHAANTACNPNSVYNGVRGEFTGRETFKYLDWLLLAACLAPFILAYIIARGNKLSWKPGEVTMIVGMIAFALIVLNGLVLGKPGDTVDMVFKIGWFVGLFGAFLMFAGGTLRQALSADAKKPPGVM